MSRNSILFNFGYYNLKETAYGLNLIPSFQRQNLLRREYTQRGEDGWNATFKIIKEIKASFDGRYDMELFFVLLPADFQMDIEKQIDYGLTQEEFDF